jgi:hypothetical protein
MTIDQTKAVDTMALLESVIRGADPDFAPPTQPPGLNATLGGLAPSSEHKARAMAIGHSVDALVMLARRQLFELANTIKIILATIPPGDVNAAALVAIVAQLRS